MCKKKQRLFNKAKRSHKTKEWQEYKTHKKSALQAIMRAHWRYINTILLQGLESKDTKPFWDYIKSQQQDAIVVSPLKQNGVLPLDAKTKAGYIKCSAQVRLYSTFTTGR